MAALTHKAHRSSPDNIVGDADVSDDIKEPLHVIGLHELVGCRVELTQSVVGEKEVRK